MSKKPARKINHHTDHEYAEGYDQGVWDTENRMADTITEAVIDRTELEGIAALAVDYFGDLATTLRHLRDLTPRQVDVLKRITRDSPVLVIGKDGERIRGNRERKS